MLLIIAQTSLQQNTYENTMYIQEVANNIQEVTRDIQKVVRDISQTTRGTAENGTEIVNETREMIVSVVSGTTTVPNAHFPHRKLRTSNSWTN